MTESASQFKEKTSTQLQFIQFFLVTYLVMLAVMLGMYVANFGASISSEHDRWGQFGDFLGGILNPLTSFFTLIVAVFVWNLQSKELSKTHGFLHEQARISRLTFADQMLMQHFDAIVICTNQIRSNTSTKNLVDVSHGDQAIEVIVNTLKTLHLKVGEADRIDNSGASADFFRFTIEQLTPLQNAIRSTTQYIERTYDNVSKESKLELLRLRLSLFTQLYFCYYIDFTKDTELLALSRRNNLLKHFPSGIAKDWIYTKADF
jgi:hypothetical protein